MNESIINAFPVARLSAAREALAKSYSRLVKAAARAGATVPAAPVLTPTNERTLVRCNECRCSTTELSPGNDCPVCTNGVLRGILVCDVEVICDRPALAGWEFLAVIEPMTAGNLVKRVPGSDESIDLSCYRTGDQLNCDHCKTARRRTETFVVRSNGSDPAVPAGLVKRVGRNCLAAFLGGVSPATILRRLTLTRIVSECAGEGGGGGRGEVTIDPIEFLTWTASAIRHDGWISKSAARAYNEAGGNKTPTAATALNCVTPPWTREAAREWRKLRERLAPTAADAEKATAALEWAKGLTGASDYEASLSLVAKEQRLAVRHAGILASAIASYERFLGKEIERKSRAALNATSNHIGVVGEKIVVTATCEGCFTVESAYGELHISRFRDAAGNVVVWKTGSVRYGAGDAVTLKGTVKAHDEYKDTKQTVLTRCSEVDPNAPVKTKRARKSA